MKTNLFVRANIPQRLQCQLCASWILPTLLLWTLPAALQAQFLFTTNNGTITITGYTGSGGAVTIPRRINGLPVTSIGNSAFPTNSSVTSVTIPRSVTNIGDMALSFDTRLTAITVDTLNPVYSSVDGVLFNKSQTSLITYPRGKAGSYTIPSSVTSIGDEAFADCTSLTSVTIPNSVTSIRARAFCGCTNLTSVTIGTNVTRIRDFAFFCCTSLTSVTIPNSVIIIRDSAFASCTSLTSVTIGTNVTSIRNGAFHYCPSLTSVTIPSSVTSIGYSAFGSCAKLTGVYFQGNPPFVDGPSVFAATYNATVYYLPGTTGWGPTFSGRPTALRKPQVPTSDANSGVRTN